MGGQDGNRGYLIQAVVALLTSLDDPKWQSVSLEPDISSDKAIAEELRNAIVGAFDARQKLLQVELKSFANRMSEMQAIVKSREQEKQAIIDKRLKELLGDSPTLPPSSGRNVPD